jgi:hypothetical protein
VGEEPRAGTEFDDAHRAASAHAQLDDDALEELLAPGPLEHCGGSPFPRVVHRAQIDRTGNVFAKLSAHLTSRQRQMADLGQGGQGGKGRTVPDASPDAEVDAAR